VQINAVALRFPGEINEKLKNLHRTDAQALQAVISELRGSEWPGPEPKAHVKVTADHIGVSWTCTSRTQAPMRLAPIPRSEVGL
jgi:hypothetical protein